MYSTEQVEKLIMDGGEWLNTAFIAGLTTLDKKGQDIPQGKERVEKMRAMQFRPDKLYAEDGQRAAIEQGDFFDYQSDRNGAEYVLNRVRFLRPMDPTKELDIGQALKNKAGIVIIQPSTRSWTKWFLRGLNMILRACTVVFAATLWHSTRQILPGNGQFGYGTDIRGNIEIYPPSTGYRVPVSPATEISIANMNAPYVGIKHHVNGQDVTRIHIINVPAGHYAFAMKNGSPVVLPEGRHLIDSAHFEPCLDKTSGAPVFVPKTQAVIQYNGIHIVRVPDGHVGHVQSKGKTMILEPEYTEYDLRKGTGIGAYVFYDPNVKICRSPENGEGLVGARHDYFQHQGNQLVELGPVRVLNVPASHAVPTYEHGRLVILHEGSHPLPDAHHQEARYKDGPSKGRIVNIDCTENATEFYSNEEIASADPMKLTLSATLFYRITDVNKCIQNKGLSDYEEYLKKTARSEMLALISAIHYAPKGDESEDSNRKQIDSTELQTALVRRLKEILGEDSGMEITNVKVTQYTPSDQYLRHMEELNLRKRNAQTTAAARAVEAAAENDALLAQAEAKAKVAQIAAASEADAAQVRAKALEDALQVCNSDAARQAFMLQEAGRAFPHTNVFVGGDRGVVQAPLLLSTGSAQAAYGGQLHRSRSASVL